MDIAAIRRNFEKRGFALTYFDTKEEAQAYLLQEIQGKTVTIGGSMTVKSMGLYEKLQEYNDVRWHDADGLPPRQGAEVYISSANGLSEQGEIVNIDGACNRVAGNVYGCKACFLVCGTNKLAPDLEQAVWRARNIAAPKNARRLNRKTPCAAKADRCYDCFSPDCICRALLVLWKRPIPIERYEVVLIGEELGF